ncbi:hypothetical protein DACRYDRAFT_112571 [Dacryopinax primogenitus]|uniref:Uncharacterized protein n=1 Tax=Dacryopinax primogenitus (strain DJM 731) TaxID=1858805 RepID=M5FNX6_DACPD|nr:uncharacterized protein DACRYDRAFT_112571 [Dacryopinax primogenitus]EJT96623.1 hypothetical protein DACRYDRAFT_112571 [Dacryopinax primogenitus]
MAPIVSQEVIVAAPAQDLLRRSEYAYTHASPFLMQEGGGLSAFVPSEGDDSDDYDFNELLKTENEILVEVLHAVRPSVLNGSPAADDVFQAIKEWFIQLWETISGFGSRMWKPIADKIAEVAGQVESFIRAHPKEIAYTVGGVLLTVALIIFGGPAILTLLGFGIWGPIAGSLVAVLRSIAMGGSVLLVANLQITAVVCFIVGLALILYSALHG